MLAMVCVIMVVVIGCAAFALDAGAGWQAKRRIRTATDAAALAAASEFAKGGSGCSTTDDTFLTANDSAATVTACTFVAPTGNGFHLTPGRVTVTGKRPVAFSFAQIFGMSSVDVKSSTTARYGAPGGASGLRPMGLCIDANPQLTAWLNLAGGGPVGDSGTIRILYNKSQPAACGLGTPGNWGMLDFNGGSNSNAETKDWVANGYPSEVPLSPPTIAGDTGAFSNSISSELTSLIGKEFGIPVYNLAVGNGSNAQFTIVAFVKVKLIGFEVNGSQASRYLDLQFKKGTLPGGNCCKIGGLNTGAMAIDICGVDESYDVLDCTL
ncbi:MAG: pilus assembly protein TadG-related protein [Actinomycetota bacterium]